MKLCLVLSLFTAVVALSGCASDSNVDNNNVDANGQQVSSVPWNKPEQWETTGQLGGMSQ